MDSEIAKCVELFQDFKNFSLWSNPLKRQSSLLRQVKSETYLDVNSDISRLVEDAEFRV